MTDIRAEAKDASDVVALLKREAERVQREMAAVDPQAGLADLKQRLKVPKPFVGYLVENADFATPVRKKTSWLFHLPPLFHGIADAKAQRAGYQAMASRSQPKVIFRVTVTFEVVEDGGDA
ncbi:hypothetical protein Caci_3002 [Catenulispora acidiphila DSM 44928]|uniref:Uncharacterized protein n=1 Tax=Catenulispora acidiphila (strain DSM 44928 / JCM 14897 / NBRC 102108 / NRRL B-24433 / ID139908) TaxID=479433 RepID=C7Q319_CATAD|nr:hypothetical protein [Catenulispora acidiphila]ACU71911.1 hypothetical protein Caci_3002 [Catenulispora acidiphila DSM 44928]